MLELKRTQNEAQLAAFLKESGLTACANYEAYEALCQGECVGYCIFSRKTGEVQIEQARAQDDALCDGLVRAVYHYACQNGISRARIAQGFDSGLWQRLQAFGHSKRIVEDIDSFLNTCRSCAVCEKKGESPSCLGCLDRV